VAIPELLEKLLTAPGPSGYEAPPTRVWRDTAAEFADVSTDEMGSSIALVQGTSGAPLLAVVGHIDEIGVIVTHIDDDGYAYFRGVGGWNPEVLIGQRMTVTTRSGQIPAVLAKKARRPLKPGEERKVTELQDLHLDLGARDGEEARSLVRPGDVAVIDVAPRELPNRRLISRSLDNRLGAYVALETARAVAGGGGPPAGDIAAIAAVQEEVGDFGGARTSVFNLEPKVALAVDVTSATDYPGSEPTDSGAHPVGSGPVIARGSTINPGVFELLAETADAEGIAYTIGVSSGTTHTDMDAIHVSRAGIAAGLVSLPTRYIHTPCELVSLDDVEAAIRLIAAFARRLEPATRFTR
jgi:putative aminopeptidase FrvX